MLFPLILIRNTKDACPELITAPWQLGLPGLDVLQKRDSWVNSNCYMDGLHARITQVSSPRKARFWECLLHSSNATYWNVKVETSPPTRDCDLDVVKMELMQAVEQDDGNLTEFYSPGCITYLINRCNSFAEILVVGCLTGMWDACNTTANLPSLVPAQENRDCVPCVTAPGYQGPFSADNIAALAKKVVFAEHSSLFEEPVAAE